MFVYNLVQIENPWFYSFFIYFITHFIKISFYTQNRFCNAEKNEIFSKHYLFSFYSKLRQIFHCDRRLQNWNPQAGLSFTLNTIIHKTINFIKVWPCNCLILYIQKKLASCVRCQNYFLSQYSRSKISFCFIFKIW